MKSDTQEHRRRSLRLKGYDYSQNNAYFITICSQNKECLFGNIKEQRMILNCAGEMLQKWWFELEHKFPNIKLDEHIIMPNHLHGIIHIVLVGADLCVCPTVKKAEKGRTYVFALFLP
ncbi:MAG: hypothetical protein L3V56_08655, partial [Candidatus Magnetoovum sp. WYHC-5]|nr:hypothetical protein [Candidatus Magnetoovum sp. WYHC-5]